MLNALAISEGDATGAGGHDQQYSAWANTRRNEKQRICKVNARAGVRHGISCPLYNAYLQVSFPNITPMTLAQLAEPFNHSEWLFERNMLPRARLRRRR